MKFLNHKEHGIQGKENEFGVYWKRKSESQSVNSVLSVVQILLTTESTEYTE
jgi:hypothetical protein